MNINEKWIYSSGVTFSHTIPLTFKETTDGVQTEYLGNGNYYMCVRDKVGNVIDDEELNKNKDKYLFQVDKVNANNPTFIRGDNAIVIRSTATGYNALRSTVTVIAQNSEGNTKGLKVCVSKVGYLQECTWKNYGSGTSKRKSLNSYSSVFNQTLVQGQIGIIFLIVIRKHRMFHERLSLDNLMGRKCLLVLGVKSKAQIIL